VHRLRLPLLTLAVTSLLLGACDTVEPDDFYLVPHSRYDSVALSPDGTRYAAVERDSTLVVREIDGDATVWQVELGSVSWPIVYYSPTGASVMVWHSTRLMEVFDASDGTHMGTHHDVYAITGVSPDDRFYSYAHNRDSLAVQIAALGGVEPKRSLTTESHITGKELSTNGWPSIIFGPAGWVLELGDSMVTARNLDTQTIYELSLPGAATTNAIVSPDGASVVLGTKDSSLHVFSLATGELTHSSKNTDGSPIPLLVTADGRTAVAVSVQYGRYKWGVWKLALWDLENAANVVVCEVGGFGHWGYRTVFGPHEQTFVRVRYASVEADASELLADAWTMDGQQLWQVALADDVPPVASDTPRPTDLRRRIPELIPIGGPVITPDGEHVFVGTYYGIWRIRLSDGYITQLRDWSTPDSYKQVSTRFFPVTD
jgi:hypothetical protein